MDNSRADENAGKCDPPDEPGCDRDPRKSTPIHNGAKGKKSIKALFAGNQNVIAYVAGHTHANRVDFFKGRKGRGFWQINTASHIDWPEQSREIEVMDNRDGTLSLFGTLLDSRRPGRRARPGPRRRVHHAAAGLARPHARLQRPAARGARGKRRRRAEDRPPQGPQRRAAGEGPPLARA